MSDRENEPQAPVADRRLDWVDGAKGVGIALVIYGHAISGMRDAGLLSFGGGWVASGYFIYTFHMPLFFFLSGLFVRRRAARPQATFLRSLLVDLGWPYLVWALICALSMALAARYANRPVEHWSFMELVAVLWRPPGYMWFLFALIAYHLATYYLLRWLGKWALLVISVCAYTLPVAREADPKILWIGLHFFLFYAAGVCTGPEIGRSLALIKRPAPAGIGVAAVWAAASAWAYSHGAYYWAPTVLTAAVAGSALVLIPLARLRNVSPILIYLGRRSLPLYLMHVLFISGARIALDKLLGVHEVALILPVLLLVGFSGPLLVFETADRIGLTRIAGLGPSVRRVDGKRMRSVEGQVPAV